MSERTVYGGEAINLYLHKRVNDTHQDAGGRDEGWNLRLRCAADRNGLAMIPEALAGYLAADTWIRAPLCYGTNQGWPVETALVLKP